MTLQDLIESVLICAFFILLQGILVVTFYVMLFGGN